MRTSLLQSLIWALFVISVPVSLQSFDSLRQPASLQDHTARALVAAHTHVPLGRANAFAIPGACTYRVFVASVSPKGLIDVALAPDRRWEAWMSCRGDLAEREVLCTAVQSCNTTVEAVDASQAHMLLVGRVSIGKGAKTTVWMRVDGAESLLCMHDPEFVVSMQHWSQP